MHPGIMALDRALKSVADIRSSMRGERSARASQNPKSVWSSATVLARARRRTGVGEAASAVT